jgi:multiple antibiotic resistance protein
MSLLEYMALAFGSLFVIIDPLASIPAFLAMTPDDSPEERGRMAALACCVTAVVLLAFSIAGQWIFKFLGVTMPAFQIAASIVLLLVALDMLRAQRSRVQETTEETEAGAGKQDIAITPLAIPMLAGPGAISTVILRLAAHGARWLSPIAMKITTRIMGLLLAAVAVQFMLNAIRDLKGHLF